MSRPLTRQEALRVLELPGSADVAAIKRAYRRLAMEHHPDLGGEPRTFHHLQRAFERLVDEPPDALPPVVSRGRPSRAPAHLDRDQAHTDLGAVDWDVASPADGRALDRDGLAVLLARDHAAPIHPVAAASRAPGSRLNGLAAMLATDLTSRMTIRPDLDDRRQVVVALQLEATNRRARRALDRVGLDGTWVRTRGSSTTVLRSSLAPDEDRRSTSVRATNRIERLLDSLAWPLPAWTVTLDRPD